MATDATPLNVVTPYLDLFYFLPLPLTLSQVTAEKESGQREIEELKEVKICILDILEKVENTFNKKEIVDYQKIIDLYQHIRELADQYNKVQIERIRSDTSKTRLSILYYAIVGNCLMLTKQNIKLLEIFNESFQFDKQLSKSYYKFET